MCTMLFNAAGPAQPVDLGASRWLLPMALVDAVLWAYNGLPASTPAQSSGQGAESGGYHTTPEARGILSELSVQVAAGVESLALQTQPHLVLLQHGYYSRHMKPLLARWMCLYLRTLPRLSHDFVNCPAATTDEKPTVAELSEAMEGYLCGASTRSASAAVLRLGLSPESIQHVNLARDWLSTFLPHILSKVRHTVFP